MGFSRGGGGQEGYTSQHSNVLVGSRRQNFGRESFLLSAPNLKDIPYKIDLPNLGQSSCLICSVQECTKPLPALSKKWALYGFNSWGFGDVVTPPPPMDPDQIPGRGPVGDAPGSSQMQFQYT